MPPWHCRWRHSIVCSWSHNNMRKTIPAGTLKMTGINSKISNGLKLNIVIILMWPSSAITGAATTNPTKIYIRKNILSLCNSLRATKYPMVPPKEKPQTTRGLGFCARVQCISAIEVIFIASFCSFSSIPII